MLAAEDEVGDEGSKPFWDARRAVLRGAVQLTLLSSCTFRLVAEAEGERATKKPQLSNRACAEDADVRKSSTHTSTAMDSKR